MKKMVVVLVAVSFVLSVSGLLFAQTPSTTAKEKAGDNAAFNRGDAKPTPKPNADKMKADKEKAAKEKGNAEKTVKEKGQKEKAAQEKAVKGKAKTEKGKKQPHIEDMKNQ